MITASIRCLVNCNQNIASRGISTKYCPYAYVVSFSKFGIFSREAIWGASYLQH